MGNTCVIFVARAGGLKINVLIFVVAVPVPVPVAAGCGDGVIGLEAAIAKESGGCGATVAAAANARVGGGSDTVAAFDVSWDFETVAVAAACFLPKGDSSTFAFLKDGDVIISPRLRIALIFFSFGLVGLGLMTALMTLPAFGAAAAAAAAEGRVTTCVVTTRGDASSSLSSKMITSTVRRDILFQNCFIDTVQLRMDYISIREQ